MSNKTYLVAYFAMNQGGIAVLFDYDSWPVRSMKVRGISLDKHLYTREATPKEAEGIAPCKRVHWAKDSTIEECLEIEAEQLADDPEAYERLKRALLRSAWMVKPTKSKKLLPVLGQQRMFEEEYTE